MVHLVGLVIDDIAINGGATGVKQPFGLAFQISEVLIGILIVDLIIRAAVAGSQGIEHHVLTGLTVVDGLGSPYTLHILPCLGIASGEIDGSMLPVNQVGTLEQHHTAVAVPTQV